MILVDTSVWVDHLRATDDRLADLLDQGQVLIHPFVIGEIALGSLRQRTVILEALRALPAAVAASDGEVLHFIQANRIMGLGVGWVDAHLLASVRLTVGSSLWTRDRRLRAAAEGLDLAMG